MIIPQTVFNVSVTDASQRPLMYFNMSAVASGYFTFRCERVSSVTRLNNAHDAMSPYQHSNSCCKPSWTVSPFNPLKSLFAPNRNVTGSINPCTKRLWGEFGKQNGIFQLQFMNNLSRFHFRVLF